MNRERPARSWITNAAVGGGVGVVVDLPGLLTGALAVPVMAELGFGTAGLGAAIASVRATASLTSVPVGRVADRLGATTSLRLAVTAALASSVGVALFATSWTLLTVALMISGVAIATGHPAANRLLSMTVPTHRQGVAFGIKQAAPPAASLLAGISVPTVALTLGWRWAFALAGGIAVVMLLGIGRRPASAPARPRPAAPKREKGTPRRRPGPVMLWLGLGFGLGTASAVVVPAFFVDAAVRAGSSVSFAGTLLAVASVVTLLMRVSMGFVADRLRGGHFKLCGTLLSVGTIGLVLLATGDRTLMSVGVVVAASALWGFNGVFWYAVVRMGGDFPATITGVMSPNGHVGGSVGPLVFGVLAAGLGYSLTWLVWTVFGVLAAVSMFAAGTAITAEVDQAVTS